MTDIVGERTRANGFTDGFVISDGILVEDLGGGVSQMATTTFNAAFFAGLEDVEHKPHSFYIDRYPVGREATVAWGAVDLRFRNDTPHGVLVTTSVTPSTPSTSGVVTVSMWSTKTWDITTRTSDRYAFTEPDTRRLDTADCYPNEGYGGFDVDVWRYFRRPGSSELVRTEKFNTTYTPSDTVICTNPAAG
jgi:vancomycin resistance protein YoaR